MARLRESTEWMRGGGSGGSGGPVDSNIANQATSRRADRLRAPTGFVAFAFEAFSKILLLLTQAHPPLTACSISLTARERPYARDQTCLGLTHLCGDSSMAPMAV